MLISDAANETTEARAQGDDADQRRLRDRRDGPATPRPRRILRHPPARPARIQAGRHHQRNGTAAAGQGRRRPPCSPTTPACSSPPTGTSGPPWQSSWERRWAWPRSDSTFTVADKIDLTLNNSCHVTAVSRDHSAVTWPFRHVAAPLWRGFSNPCLKSRLPVSRACRLVGRHRFPRKGSMHRSFTCPPSSTLMYSPSMSPLVSVSCLTRS